MNLSSIAKIVSYVGAINWGLIAALEFNVVEKLFASSIVLEKVAYGVIGLCGAYSMFRCLTCSMPCDKK